ncbi:hypothetical protein NC651_016490 [Populus alba x Populus x berolinensis]|nr:hypothetical protein NC651_016490 [Populus alba x Populus x berolinensis]
MFLCSSYIYIYIYINTFFLFCNSKHEFRSDKWGPVFLVPCTSYEACSRKLTNIRVMEGERRRTHEKKNKKNNSNNNPRSVAACGNWGNEGV